MFRVAGIRVALVIAALAVVASCDNPASPVKSESSLVRFGKTVSTGPQVSSVLPSDASRDTTIDIQVNGSGFDKGSIVALQRDGVSDARVRVNSTRYVKASQLVANVTIAADAITDRYDVAVTTAGGKKGIGTEMFEVTADPTILEGGTHAIAVNENGDAVGNGTSNAPCSSPSVPFLWSASGTTTILPMAPFCGAAPKGINNGGVIVGWLFGGANNQSGLWLPGASGYTLTVVPPTSTGYNPIIGGGINDANEIIGWGQSGAQVFWWSMPTGWMAMQVPAGATACQVWDGINNSGQIVGRCTVGGIQNAYIWADHSSSPRQLPRPSGSGDVAAIDINDSGVIVGRSTSGALRWTPENGAYTSVEVLPNPGAGATASEVASDGSVAGSVNALSNGYGRPAYWPASGGYRLLGTNLPKSWGDARGIAMTPAGMVIVGSERNSQSLKWIIR
jgi:hypothetical protein